MEKKILDSVVHQARTIKTLESVLDLITWDQETLMPPAGSTHRGEQRALLSGMIHLQRNDPTFSKNVFTLREQAIGADDGSIIIKRLAHDLEKAHKLPVQFVETFSKVTSDGFCAWSKAREADNFAAFQPHLERIVDLIKQKCELLGYEAHPYNALIDLYEPEMTVGELDTFFSSLKPKLKSLLRAIPASPRSTPLPSTLPQQLAVCRSLVTTIGFDWTGGRMDTSDHPFSSGIHSTDTRITVRRHSADILDQAMSALHEAGHAFYESGLPVEQYGTPLAEAASYATHESQSRFWETVIGRSRSFTPHVMSALTEALGRISRTEEELYREINHVGSSFIRTEADEVTYPLHIILRYEIEKELLTGSLAVKEVPERWNSLMEDLLGIRPKTNREGCLQDVHWAFGNIGYFPTYTLGSLYAIAYYKAMERSIPNLDWCVRAGQFEKIRSWLKENVWQHGRRYLGKELVTRALGRPPTDDDYIAYLEHKFISES